MGVWLAFWQINLLVFSFCEDLVPVEVGHRFLRWWGSSPASCWSSWHSSASADDKAWMYKILICELLGLMIGEEMLFSPVHAHEMEL